MIRENFSELIEAYKESGKPTLWRESYFIDILEEYSLNMLEFDIPIAEIIKSLYDDLIKLEDDIESESKRGDSYLLFHPYNTVMTVNESTRALRLAGDILLKYLKTGNGTISDWNGNSLAIISKDEDLVTAKSKGYIFNN